MNPPETPDRQRAPFTWVLLGLLVFACSAAPLVRYYLADYPRESWQVDLEVYREGARALVHGWTLYDVRTEAPQFLPFTYPPFAAVAALPLALASFAVMGWVWTGVQLALLWFTVGLAFRPLLARLGHRRGLGQGVLAAGGIWLLPVSEGIRFGQVNAVIVALCLADVARRAPADRPLRIPRGVLTGLAAAVKLTPGVFWLHWAVVRRWGLLAASIGGTAVATLVTVFLLPQESGSYWGSVLFDPDRLGPNAGTSNQSLRGVLLRLGPDGTAGSVLWLVLVIVTIVVGLTVSARMERVGDQVAVVAAVGMVAFLISPVSWVHHMHWGVVVIGALLGDGRRRARIACALAAAALLWMRLPWWGSNLLAGDAPQWFARLLQNSYSWWAFGALAALWWLARERHGEAPSSTTDEPAYAEVAPK